MDDGGTAVGKGVTAGVAGARLQAKFAPARTIRIKAGQIARRVAAISIEKLNFQMFRELQFPKHHPNGSGTAFP
jgi:hypothetical protein